MEADRRLFPADVFTEEAFLWAVAAVRCRVHAPLDGDQLALVPLVDLVRGQGCEGPCQAQGFMVSVRASAPLADVARNPAQGSVMRRKCRGRKVYTRMTRVCRFKTIGFGSYLVQTPRALAPTRLHQCRCAPLCGGGMRA